MLIFIISISTQYVNVHIAYSLMAFRHPPVYTFQNCSRACVHTKSADFAIAHLRAGTLELPLQLINNNETYADMTTFEKYQIPKYYVPIRVQLCHTRRHLLLLCLQLDLI